MRRIKKRGYKGCQYENLQQASVLVPIDGNLCMKGRGGFRNPLNEKKKDDHEVYQL